MGIAEEREKLGPEADTLSEINSSENRALRNLFFGSHESELSGIVLEALFQ